MITLLLLFLFFADPNSERRAQAALLAAAAAERDAETAYDTGNVDTTKTDLQTMAVKVQEADEGFRASGKTPGRNAGTYKPAELKTRELLLRLGDLEKKMDALDRAMIEVPKAKVQEIHDAWFEGIMGGRKKEKQP